MPQIQVTFTPAESKRLIGIAVARLPEVQRAMREGTVVIGVGTTNACVAEELLGQKIDRERFVAGMVLPDGTYVLPAEKRLKEMVIRGGKVLDARLDEVLPELTSRDVFIKGANAIDASGTAGIFIAGQQGGTIGRSIGTLRLRGVNLIIPVGLEKFVPGSIKDVSKLAGTDKVDFSTGTPVGIMPVHGEVITELEAIYILTGAEAMVMGRGGVSGAEGAVTLLIMGDRAQLRKVRRLVASIKGGDFRRSGRIELKFS